MFSAIKKLFGRKSAVETYTRTPENEPDFNEFPVAASAPPAPLKRAVPAPGRRPFTPKPVNGSGLSLPLKSILTRLSPEAMRMVRMLDVGDTAILLPLPNILAQIPRGSVKITLGELRAVSPPGVFAEDNVLDQSLVELPLQEVICRLDPALLSRRPAQHQVVVPAEVAGPFGNEVRKAAAVLAQAPVSAPAAAPVQAAASKGAEPVARPVARLRVNPPKVPAARVAEAAPAVPPAQARTPITASIPAKPFETSRPPQDPAPGLSPTPVPLPEILNRSATPARVQARPRVFTPIDPDPVSDHSTPAGPISMGDFARNVPPATPITPIAPAPAEERPPIRFQTAPIVPEPVAPAVADGRILTVALDELAAAWPDPIQKEIAKHQVSTAPVHLPVAMIEVAIKQGRVSLPWRVVRTWVQPPGVLGLSVHDATVLELPLKVITPLFLAELKAAKPQRKIAVDPSIPDLFSGGVSSAHAAAVSGAAPASPEISATAPQRVQSAPAQFPRSSSLPPAPAEVAPAPLQPTSFPPPVAAGMTPKKPADTNYFGKDAAEAAEEPDELLLKQGGSLSTAFLNRYATPNEIVGRAMAIEGVEGALIALPDGLLVASQIPSTMNAETIAAFLPQLYGKVSQCTKELRLGELNNINFTVGQIPWKIYKVGAIYFAAFGRAGEPLPTAEIAAVAGELDRNGK